MSEPHSDTSQECLLKKERRKGGREGGMERGNGRRFSVTLFSELMLQLVLLRPLHFGVRWSRAQGLQNKGEHRHKYIWPGIIQGVEISFFCKTFLFFCLFPAQFILWYLPFVNGPSISYFYEKLAWWILCLLASLLTYIWKWVGREAENPCLPTEIHGP